MTARIIYTLSILSCPVGGMAGAGQFCATDFSPVTNQTYLEASSSPQAVGC